MYNQVRLIAETRSVRKRRSAMRRQAKRNRETAVYGAPVHAERETDAKIEAFARAEIAKHYARKG